VLNDFLERFHVCSPVPTKGAPPGYGPAPARGVGEVICSRPHKVTRHAWLSATQSLNGSGPNQRGKYKSAYVKRSFTAREAQRMYAHLTKTVAGVDLSQSLVQVDSYGGAINSLGRSGAPPYRSGRP
jgi:hypothetical protein